MWVYVVGAAAAVLLVVGAFVLWIGQTVHHNEQLLTESSAICTKSGYGNAGAPIPVKLAVARLRAAGMSTHPWDLLPSSDLIVECAELGGISTLADAFGQHSPAPPSPTCTPSSTTTGLPQDEFGTATQCFVGYSLGAATHFASC
jgi:hypothetical protein